MKVVKFIFLIIRIVSSGLYGLIVYIRNTLYNYKIITIHKFNKPIISVGNITLGGTGKTPLVIYIAQMLLKNGNSPGIISRGYGRVSSGIQIVHDGKKLLSDIKTSGDEPYLIAKTLNKVPVVVSEKRVLGIRQLIETFFCDIIIMDDGFQNRKINRDLNLLTVSTNDLLKDYRMFPWGKLRESIKNINRADYIIYTKTNNFRLPAIDSIIKKFTAVPKTTSILKPTLMKYSNKSYFKSAIPDAPCFAFCGIADPHSFIKMANNLSINIYDHLFFLDHQDYNQNILNKLLKKINLKLTNNILTTEKDLFKLPQWFYENNNIYVIKINLEIEKQTEMFNKIQSIL